MRRDTQRRSRAAFEKNVCDAIESAIFSTIEEIKPDIYCEMRGWNDIRVSFAGDDIECWTLVELVKDYIQWINKIEDKEDEWDVARMFEVDAAEVERCVVMLRKAAERYRKKQCKDTH